MPTHLIVGPDNHGVTAYAVRLAEASGASAIVREPEFGSAELPPGPVHVTFTDHLFGPDPQTAVDRLLDRIGSRALSVSLHDIPQPEEGEERFARRAEAYRRLAAAAWRVVVNSQHEAAFFEGAGEGTGRVHVIPLPVPEVESSYDPVSRSVGVLGFLYPGKGHEVLIEQLAGSGYILRCLGQVSAGHEKWAEQLLARAAQLGVPMEITGWLDDAELAAEMGRIEIPVCAHRHFSASGSLMTWLGAGRQVLVSDAAYSREIASRYESQLTLVSDGTWREAIDAFVPADPVTPEHHGWAEVARAWNKLWYPQVSVVIPHYNAHDSLARTLDSVWGQDYPGDVEIIVADDGSDEVPRVDGVLTVTQPDEGFRAAAARNLGAGVASGEILAFVDADTILEPDYLRCATAHLMGRPRGVVVGSRMTGRQRREPEWLRDAWATTDHLARADDGSWRFIISAVLTCQREFFAELGGFDATMVGYGGEDWDFGYRAWNAGADFVHAPDARAFHPEPDWGERHGDAIAAAAEKNAETIALATRITHPLARPQGIVFDNPDVVVTVTSDGWLPGVEEAVLCSWLAAGDVHVVVSRVPALLAHDPRVRTDSIGARVEVQLEQPWIPAAGSTRDLLDALSTHGRIVADGFVASTARARALGWEAVVVADTCTRLDGPVRLERFFAGW